MFVDRINNLDVLSWMHYQEKDTQIVKGRKTFNGDVHVTRSLHLTNLNGINLTELHENVLKIDEDQIITGKHHVKDVVIER